MKINLNPVVETWTVVLFSVLIVAVSGCGGQLATRLESRDNQASPLTTPFTAYPVDLSRIKSITPLGNLNPPGHTFPTDHMYFYGHDGQEFEIYAPGNITLTRLKTVKYLPPQSGVSEDYSIEFIVNRQLRGKLGHVNRLSAPLLRAIGAVSAEGDEAETWEVAGRTYKSWSKTVNLPMRAGALLGVAGLGGGCDFWLKDTRISLSFVNQDWSREFQNTACPLAYFSPDLKRVLEGYLKDYAGNSVVPAGFCGKIDFDIPGTAQGIWVRPDYRPGRNRAEDIGLALVYDNFNASKGAISIGMAGDYTWDESVYAFTPTHSGYANRAFGEVKPDGNLYYYLLDPFGPANDSTKAVLIRMDDANHLRLQFVSTDQAPSPADPRAQWSTPASILYVR